MQILCNDINLSEECVLTSLSSFVGISAPASATVGVGLHRTNTLLLPSLGVDARSGEKLVMLSSVLDESASHWSASSSAARLSCEQFGCFPSKCEPHHEPNSANSLGASLSLDDENAFSNSSLVSCCSSMRSSKGRFLNKSMIARSPPAADVADSVSWPETKPDELTLEMAAASLPAAGED